MVEDNRYDQARRATPQRLSILDTSPNAMLDDIADVAARALDCPVVVISLGSKQRISYSGVDVIGRLSRDDGLCGIAVMPDHPWVLENAGVDLRTLADPLVAGNYGLGFYAGVPLRSSDGHYLGMLAAVDREPRTISESDLTILKKLAGVVEHLLETRLELRIAIRTKNPPLTSVA